MKKTKMKIKAMVLAVIMVISGIGIIPIKADAAGRKLVKKLVVEKASLNLEKGESESIKYNVMATKGTNKKIIIKISDKKVISAKTIGKKIIVRAKKEGESTITVMSKAKNKNGKRIAKKIRVIVENENYDDDEPEYDFEDNEIYEEDEAAENKDVNVDKNITTEKEAGEKVAVEENTGAPVIAEKPLTTEKTTGDSSAVQVSATTGKITEIPALSYQAHVQETGWMPNVKDGAIAGTTGKGKRLESLKIALKDDKGNSMVKYRAHVENAGWQGWKTSGQVAGTENQSKRMEGIQIQLTGTFAEKYDIYYSVHVAEFGWLGWAKNGETAGSEGLSLQMEAIRIRLVKKNAAFSVGGRHSIVKPKLTYQAHCAYAGWKSLVSDGKTAGTIGEKRQMEGLKINLADADGKSGIEYRAHVSYVGWQGWKNSGELAGTIGESRKLEAVEIKLKGNLAKDFDIYYRMHVAEIGWMGWAKNGETAGTTGGSRQAEAIEIRIVGKGAVIDRGGAAYQKLKEKTVPFYNVNAALKYASNHWNDGQGLCAEFVSKCVQAGGISIKTEYITTNCYNAVANATGVQGQILRLNAQGYATKDLNSSILSAGDVVIQWCNTHTYRPHILLCGGYDSSGYATFYAHNSAKNNERFRFNVTYSSQAPCNRNCNIGARVLHISD